MTGVINTETAVQLVRLPCVQSFTSNYPPALIRRPLRRRHGYNGCSRSLSESSRITPGTLHSFL